MGIHFIHIGKTGGLTIKEIVKNNSFPVKLHHHEFRLMDLPEGDKCFFCMRGIYSRFCSAFYEMKKRPARWKETEKKTFRLFSRPEELAQGLKSTNKNVRLIAEEAFEKTNHFARGLSFWFQDSEYLMERKNDIIYVLRQKFLTQDFEVLKKKLDINKSIKVPKINKNTNGDYNLSPSSKKILDKVYKGDKDILKACEKIRETKQ